MRSLSSKGLIPTPSVHKKTTFRLFFHPLPPGYYQIKILLPNKINCIEEVTIKNIEGYLMDLLVNSYFKNCHLYHCQIYSGNGVSLLSAHHLYFLKNVECLHSDMH